MNAPHLTALVRTRRRRPRSARCLCGERTIGHIHRIHAASGKTYGARRTHRQLRRKDLAAARHAIERLMCEGRPCAAACCSQVAGAGRGKRYRGRARAWRNHLAAEVKPGMACIIARVTSSASLKRGAMTTGGRPGARSGCSFSRSSAVAESAVAGGVRVVRHEAIWAALILVSAGVPWV
ncbi:IS3 family transposase [Streptomyces anulatus]